MLIETGSVGTEFFMISPLFLIHFLLLLWIQKRYGFHFAASSSFDPLCQCGRRMTNAPQNVVKVLIMNFNFIAKLLPVTFFLINFQKFLEFHVDYHNSRRIKYQAFFNSR